MQIARRKLTFRGTQRTVTVSMTAPRKLRGKPAFVVLIGINGIGLRVIHRVLGVDEFQAIDLAMRVIGRELESKRYSGLRWRYGMNQRDLGFPRSDDQKLPGCIGQRDRGGC